MKDREKKKEAIIKRLSENSRISLSEISGEISVPVSEIYDIIKEDIKPHYDFVMVPKKTKGEKSIEEHETDLEKERDEVRDELDDIDHELMSIEDGTWKEEYGGE